MCCLHWTPISLVKYISSFSHPLTTVYDPKVDKVLMIVHTSAEGAQHARDGGTRNVCDDIVLVLQQFMMTEHR